MIKVTTESDPTAARTRFKDIAGDFAADGVEIAAAVDIEDVAAFAAIQDERLVLGHLREGVPDERAVPAAEVVGRV